MADTWMPPSETLYSGQFISSTQVIKPNYHIWERFGLLFQNIAISLPTIFVPEMVKTTFGT